MGRDKNPSNSRIMLFSDLGGTPAWRFRQPYFEVDNGKRTPSPRYDAAHLGTRGRMRSFQTKNQAGVWVTATPGTRLTPVDVARILRVDLKSMLLPSMARWSLVKTVADLEAVIESVMIEPKE